MTNLEIHDVEQRSDEWRALRLGKLTGTRAGCCAVGISRSIAGCERRDDRGVANRRGSCRATGTTMT